MQPTQRPTLRLVVTTEFGHVTDITITLDDSSLGSLILALRSALLGAGYAPESVDEWIPNE